MALKISPGRWGKTTPKIFLEDFLVFSYGPQLFLRRFCRGTPANNQRRRDNKNKICGFEGGGPWGQRGESSKNAVFHGKRWDIVGLLQRSKRPLPRKPPRRAWERGSWGLSAPGLKKLEKEPKKSQKPEKKNLKNSHFRLFFELFQPRGREAPGTPPFPDSFRRLSRERPFWPM